jgi:hypothetical protein
VDTHGFLSSVAMSTFTKSTVTAFRSGLHFIHIRGGRKRMLQ